MFFEGIKLPKFGAGVDELNSGAEGRVLVDFPFDPGFNKKRDSFPVEAENL